MNNKHCLFLMILVVCCDFIACKKVIQVHLLNAAPQIVIEGNITDLPGPYQVQISKTVNFSADNNFPPVSGAIVQITDSTTAVSEILTESTPGTYTTNSLQGFPGHRYNLSVTAEGQQYTASSTMPQPVDLDSVNFSIDIGLGNDRIIDAVVNFPDPPGPGNCYQFTETINGKLLDRIFVFNDRLSDGKYISQILFTDSAYLHVGDTLQLQMFCIDPNVYNYFNTLELITEDNSSQSATPANPTTNISNGSLGYFSAHTIFARELRVY